MAKHQKLVNKVEGMMARHVDAYSALVRCHQIKATAVDVAAAGRAYQKARNDLLGFIGNLAEENERLKKDVETLMANQMPPKCEPHIPFDLNAAKDGKPIQVKRSMNGKVDWLDARFVGTLGNGTICYETPGYGAMFTQRPQDAFRMKAEFEEVTLYLNVYKESSGYFCYGGTDSKTMHRKAGSAAVVTSAPVTITVVK